MICISDVTNSLDFPRQDLSNGDIVIVVTPLVRQQIDSSCACRWLAIQP